MPNATVSGFMADIRQAVSSLRQVPVFAGTVIVTMGLCLGALICTLTLAKLIFLEPLPYPDQNRLYSVQGVMLEKGSVVYPDAMSYPLLAKVHEQKDLFEQKAIMAYSHLKLEQHAQQPELTANFVTPDYFSLLDIPMGLGRPFTDSEKMGTANPVAVLSYETWQRYFGGQEDILGQTIILSGDIYTVVGVTDKTLSEPALFSDSFTGSAVWLPWDFNQAEQAVRNNPFSIRGFLATLVKLKPDATPQAVTHTLNSAFKDLTYQELSIAPKLVLLEEVMLSGSRTTALMLLASALALLLIAGSNVANLMLSRTIQIERSLAIKAVLGANRTHLFLGLLAENILLMLGVTLLAIGTAYGGFIVLKSLAAGALARLDDMSLDLITLLLTLAIALLLALIFSGLGLRTVKLRQLQASIQSSGKGGGLQVSARERSVLVASQILLTCLLVATSVNVLLPMTEDIFRPTGLEPKGLTYLSIDPGANDESDRRRSLAARQAISRHPTISEVASTIDNPLIYSDSIAVERYVDDPEPISAALNRVSESYFLTLGQPLTHGRSFTADEVRDKAPVTIISSDLADGLFPGKPALGESIKLSWYDDQYTIVGIFNSLTLPPALQGTETSLLIPQEDYLNGYHPNLEFVVRMKPEQALSDREWDTMIKAIDPDYQLSGAQDIEAYRLDLLEGEITTATISFALTLLSLMLAAIGLYGVVRYNVELQRFELGTRMALGATPGAIIRHVMVNSIKPVLLGGLLSVIAGVVIYSVARQHVDEFLTFQGLPMFYAGLLILLMALIASWLPVRPLVKRWPVYALRPK